MHCIDPSKKIKPRQKSKASLRRMFSFVLAIVLLFSAVSVSVFAAWDGSGSSGGSGGTENVTGNYWIDYMGIEDAMGYRFSIYDANGKKVGHSIDIDFKSPSFSVKRSYMDSKQSHIDLHREYTDDPTNVKIDDFSTDASEAGYVYTCSTIPILNSPPTIGDWLSEDNADYIADLCDAQSFGATSTHYMIVEPLFVAYLADSYYAMTMAEYAVYQANQLGSWTTPIGSNHVDGTYMYNIGRFTSAVWGRYLYATGNYSVLGTSPVVESDHLATDGAGTLSVLLPGNNSSRNTAENVLKYQVGMAVYTDIVPTYALDLNGLLDGTSKDNISGFGTCDIYINGNKVADDVSDYYSYHPTGSSYEIKDIRTESGKIYTGVYSGNASGTISESTSVYLNFTTGVYSVTFDANGGVLPNPGANLYSNTNPDNTVSVTYDTSSYWWMSADIPTKEGFVFSGWYTDPTSGTQVYTADGVATECDYWTSFTQDDVTRYKWIGTTDLTVYAHWEPVMFSVVYAGNGASSGSTPEQTIEYGTSVEILDNGFWREGYVFKFWNTSSDGLGTAYNIGDTYTPAGNITLYAIWEKDNTQASLTSGYLRFINSLYLESLLDNSTKWGSDALKETLTNALSADLSDTTSCDQVWYFSADEYEKVHEWCLEHDKGEQTNQAFLDEFAANHKTHPTE